MPKPTPSPGNTFLTCAIHLFNWPPQHLRGDPPALHPQDEAIAKMDRFCHHIYNVPITWLCTFSALQEYGELLARFHRDHGDEVAIMEGGIAAGSSLHGDPERYQGWVEACGLKRPDAFDSSEPEARSTQTFHDMPYEDIRTALDYLKRFYDDVIGQNTRVLHCPHGSGALIRAMKSVGLDVLRGYCWDYFAEGINHKGSLFYPFCISEENQTAPTQAPAPGDVLAAHWGPWSPAIACGVEVHARMGQPGYCLNALELANRSEGHDKFRFHEDVVAEWLSQAAWNPYVHLPLQLEGVWIDEGEISEEWYDQYPTFNPRNTEVFYTEIETALRLGAQPMTTSGFADWHREHVGDTSEQVYVSEDLLPDLRSKGKDQAYQPMVLFGNRRHQFWFNKSRGFNYIRRYRYDPMASEEDSAVEYPFDTEPRVYLQIKRSVAMQTGIVLTNDRAAYEVNEFGLTAYHDDPDYAAILWEANVPAYVRDEDLAIGGAVTGFRLVREKNLAILFASLKQGLNPMVFRSDAPNEHVRIRSVEKVGRRYEVWIGNDADEVGLHTLSVRLEPGLRIGGFWWDGHYSHTIYRYGWGHYDRWSGGLLLRAFYPVTLPVRSGLTRVSIELLR